MPRIACNRISEHVQEMRSILDTFADADYVRWEYDEMLANIGDYDALMPAISIPVDQRILDAARNLKVIATPSTGRDHIDLEGAADRNIAVLSLKDDTEFLRKVTSTAEQALALLLSCVRKLPWAFEAVKRGEWNSAEFRGHSLSNKTLGIIGYGRLGEMMARYGHALWMEVLATDPYKTIDVGYVEQTSLDELLRRSDVVSLHVHLNDETRGMIGKKEFAMMKDDAVIINTSRGAIIDEEALLDALKADSIGGAGLDVLTSELYEEDMKKVPIVEYAQTSRKVVISPHVGGVTYESQEMAYSHIARKLKNWFVEQNLV